MTFLNSFFLAYWYGWYIDDDIEIEEPYYKVSIMPGDLMDTVDKCSDIAGKYSYTFTSLEGNNYPDGAGVFIGTI